jgi:threonine dehydrogenase-like Zn-dependent dehydrogenase
VKTCGICGSDVDQYDGKLNGLLSLPTIPGHEPVGIIEDIGADATIYADEDVVGRVRELTHGEGADVVVAVGSSYGFHTDDPPLRSIR